MSVSPLSNPRSDRVRGVAALGRRAIRTRTGQFLVEGPQAVRELFAHVPQRARQLYVTEHAAERYAPIVQDAAAAGVEAVLCTDQVLAAMADAATPQGILAVADKLDVSLDDALAGVGDGFIVVCAQVRDPGNAGTVLRGADAFGASAVVLTSGSVDVYNPKVVRSTVGTMFHLPVVVDVPVEQALQACRREGLATYAADGAGERLLPQVDVRRRHAWVMGNEAWGLPPEIRDLCDDVVAIPIERAESLNLAMAATVCLYASSAARSG